MPTTTNKGYEVPTPGTETDTWGATLNTDTFALIDNNVGGTVSKTLSSSQVDLTAGESQNLIVRLTGTLTANVLVTTLANGFQIVDNATSGDFAVTFQRNGVGSAITIPQGERVLVALGATAGARSSGSSVTSDFASGDRMLFQQTAAPTGWTKESSSTYNAAALRFTTGAVTTGGSLDFTTAFTSRSITGTVGNTTLSISQMPAHTHTGSLTATGRATKDIQSVREAVSTGSAAPITYTTDSTGGGGSHNHTVSVNNLNMAVKYADVIIAQKD